MGTHILHTLGATAAIIYAIVYSVGPRGRQKFSARPRSWTGQALLIVQYIQQITLSAPREDGMSLLTFGLTTSNILSAVITILSAFYVTYIIVGRKLHIFSLFSGPYRAIMYMLAVYALSCFWSISFSYSLYRLFELATFTALAICTFRGVSSPQFHARFVLLFTVIWLAVNSGRIIESLESGVVFSSAKDNIFPAVAFFTIVIAFYTRGLQAYACMTFGLLAFAAAGSAASTFAMLASATVPLMYSRRILVRLFAYFGLLVTSVLIIHFFLFPGRFQELAHFVGGIIQKPVEELTSATGRYVIWDVLATATKDNVFGSGFASDRFVQLLAGLPTVVEVWGAEQVNLASAHNALLSSWVASGYVGVSAVLIVYISAVQWCISGPSSVRPGASACITFLILNGLTVPGIGAVYTVQTLVWLECLAWVEASIRQKTTGTPWQAPDARAKTAELRRPKFLSSERAPWRTGHAAQNAATS